jgi:hypothetical protein
MGKEITILARSANHQGGRRTDIGVVHAKFG